jgi:hypothetical protein
VKACSMITSTEAGMSIESKCLQLEKAI